MNSWTRQKALWYARAAAVSDYGAAVAKAMAGPLDGCRTLLDIGAGVGALALPLASLVEEVTALEPSLAMIEQLKEAVKVEGVNNIKIVPGSWGQVKISPHDAVLCANVPGLWHEAGKFLGELQALAQRAVFIIFRAGPNRDKFYLKELYPLLFGRPYPPKDDYLPLYQLLHSQGIYAHVRILDYNLDQPFDALDEAVDFWKQHMGLKDNSYDEQLKIFLSKKLQKTAGGLLAPLPKQSALIWWRK